MLPDKPPTRKPLLQINPAVPDAEDYETKRRFKVFALDYPNAAKALKALLDKANVT
jgi:hypothetical protein